MQWNKNHFTGLDYDNKSNTNAIWRFKDKSWAYEVDEELGNYDYL
jgi:alpha-amylase